MGNDVVVSDRRHGHGATIGVSCGCGSPRTGGSTAAGSGSHRAARSAGCATQLAALKDSGALTEQELEAQKARILGE